ncbi:MAG: ROK family protein, partial [Agathobaculum sp.]|nr:ROK family protein [Agathobaculum sp.]
LGHIVIRQGGEPCGCGRRGCLEAYSSAAALVKFAHRALDAGRESSLRENGSDLNAKHICDAVDAGDALACELFETYCDDLACGLSSFINIFQPECIVLGGGLAGYGEKLLAPLRRRIEKETFRGDTNTELVLASLGNDAGLVGAAML